MVTDHISSIQKMCKKWLYSLVWRLLSASAVITLGWLGLSTPFLHVSPLNVQKAVFLPKTTSAAKSTTLILINALNSAALFKQSQ